MNAHKILLSKSHSDGYMTPICFIIQAHDVLNGIAWDEDNHRLFVTGKLWPTLYEIKLRHIEGPPDGSIEQLCPRIIIPGSGNFPLL
uniref:Glutaminyl-peptide cyclotransferase n=1 Tax=Aegilops tauschii subsp. strangulata TaxID=200361 RepID=A0A453QGQ1_AEGTS